MYVTIRTCFRNVCYNTFHVLDLWYVLCVCVESLMSVSYTHLDVYKRQVYEEGCNLRLFGSSVCLSEVATITCSSAFVYLRLLPKVGQKLFASWARVSVSRLLVNDAV